MRTIFYIDPLMGLKHLGNPRVYNTYTMLWLMNAIGGVILSPAPPKRVEEVKDVWVSSLLQVRRVPDFTLTATGDPHGYAVHLSGTWSDPQDVPSAYMLIGTGDRSDVRSVTLYVRGKGKYRVQVFLQRGDRLHMTQKVVEATDTWAPITINTTKTIEVLGGLADRPGVSFPFKVVILPYMNKETGEANNAFDLDVSPVFVQR